MRKTTRYKKRHVKRLSAAGYAIILVCLAVLICFGYGTYTVIDRIINKGGITSSEIESDLLSNAAEPEEITVVSTAKVVSTGDLLMHLPIINGAARSDGSYNFDSIFSEISSLVSNADYAVANLETTLAGESKKYSGYPTFNCPDSIIDAAKNAGFDMMLTANNHSYDTGLNGFLRTQEVIAEKGLDHIGSRPDTNTTPYIIKDINGIKIGMTCYTYETDTEKENRKALNGILLAEEATDLINSFNLKRLDVFYDNLRSDITSMRARGADCIVVYMHWGDEYRLDANSSQVEISQKLCDMGVDVIIGGHPHVVEPAALLTSESDPTHKTACIYSMGNAVSNQRTARASIKTGHTEDGMLFSYTFTKYSDGEVALTDVEIIPTWVHLYTSGGKAVYQIVPLDGKSDYSGTHNLDSASSSQAVKSYDRTKKIVSEGLNDIQTYLASAAKAKLEGEPLQPDNNLLSGSSVVADLYFNNKFSNAA